MVHRCSHIRPLRLPQDVPSPSPYLMYMRCTGRRSSLTCNPYDFNTPIGRPCRQTIALFLADSFLSLVDVAVDMLIVAACSLLGLIHRVRGGEKWNACVSALRQPPSCNWLAVRSAARCQQGGIALSYSTGRQWA